MASPRASRSGRASSLTDGDAIARQKREAASAAAELVHDGMRVGLGTGSTVAYLLPALAARELRGVSCVASSPASERAARALGLELEPLDGGRELDLYIDGADQVDPAGWLVKGGGAAHTREKILAVASARFVVIVSAEKCVERITPPVPLELVRFGVSATLRLLGDARLRDVPTSPDGGAIADYHGPVEDPATLAAHLDAVPGVVAHGLFSPELVSEVLIGSDAGVERRAGGRERAR